MAIVWTDVEAIAPEITGLVPAGAQSYFLGLVDRQIDDVAWDDLADDGRRWLAAHYGSKYAQAAAGGPGSGAAGAVGPVTSETLGPMSQSYGELKSATANSSAAGDLGTTRYGLEYLRLIQLLPGSIGFVA